MADLWGYGVPGPGERTATTDHLNNAIADFGQHGYSQEPGENYGDCVSNSLGFLQSLHPSLQPRLQQFFHPTMEAFPQPPRRDLKPSDDEPGHWETTDEIAHKTYAPAEHYAPVVHHQGQDYVVDWTLNQFDPHAQVPHVEPLDNYRNKFSWDEPTSEFDDEWKRHTAHRTAMPAPLPEGITFHYHPTDDSIRGTAFYAPAVEARLGGRRVGHLAWDGADKFGNVSGKINDIRVHKDLQRHGIATAMMDFARQHEPKVRHSNELSPSGEQWMAYETSRPRTAMPWYHVSPHDLPDGETLVPRGSPSPFEESLYADPDNEWRGDATWITDSPENARRWQKMLYNETGTYPEHLYEVEPEGRPEPQVYGDFYNAPPEYSVPSARIIRKIKPKKARTMTAAVTVYTRPSCPQCTMTHKLLNRLGVEHTTVDVTTDPEAHAYVTGLGYQAAPVVVVGDGEQHWGGFKVDRLKGLVSGE